MDKELEYAIEKIYSNEARADDIKMAVEHLKCVESKVEEKYKKAINDAIMVGTEKIASVYSEELVNLSDAIAQANLMLNYKTTETTIEDVVTNLELYAESQENDINQNEIQYMKNRYKEKLSKTNSISEAKILHLNHEIKIDRDIECEAIKDLITAIKAKLSPKYRKLKEECLKLEEEKNTFSGDKQSSQYMQLSKNVEEKQKAFRKYNQDIELNKVIMKNARKKIADQRKQIKAINVATKKAIRNNKINKTVEESKVQQQGTKEKENPFKKISNSLKRNAKNNNTYADNVR